MKSIPLAIIALSLSGSVIIGFADSYVADVDFDLKVDSTTMTFKYDRIDEVKKHCAFVLSSASELKPDRAYSVKEELQFGYGDWGQETGNAPLLPFDDREVPRNSPRTPLKLVSFWVTDVDHTHQPKKFVSVSGDLMIGITLDNSFEGSPQFQIWPSHTQLSISFQGIYGETKKNGGERVICMLGTTMLPSRESESADPWEWVKASYPNYNQPPLLQDDQILLVLRYPMIFTLTNREVQGSLKSLNPKSNPKYFDQVHISSQPINSHYQFGSEKIVSKACDPHPYEDSLTSSHIDTYKGSGFCNILMQITQDAAFTVVPNWRCNGTDEFCSKLGPFGSEKGIKASDGSFKDVKLFVQNVKCEQTLVHSNSTSAKVAAVFRVAPPSSNQYPAAWRSGLGNTTLAAEGIWKSSNGQLCMVGCLGFVDSEGSSCDSRICLYLPVSFSIKQRSIVVGSISSIDKSKAPYFPLSFEKLAKPRELWNYFRTSSLYYSYSKIESAGIVLEKNEPFSFRTVIKKALLQFPKLEDAESFESSLSLLSEDLTLHIIAVPDALRDSLPPRTNIQMEIISLGPLFGRYWSQKNSSTVEEESPYQTKAEYTEKQLLLNVSAQIALSGEAYSNFSALFLEGLYDPHVGKMYLVGCRDVRASWKILFDSMDLEAGLDCLIEVVVSYPPTTTRWLVNPTATISVSSQRNEDDPLHFDPLKLQTVPILYRKQREDILSRRGVEGILRILTLTFSIACISSQLFYIKHNVDSVPFISLTMLGVQALGYSLPLITGAEALFKRGSSDSYEEQSYDLEKNQWFHVIDYTVKLLVMVSFLLILRLCQKVWKSRLRLLARSPLESHLVPSDKRVFQITFVVHLLGYAIVFILHTSQRALRTQKVLESTGEFHMLPGWEIELEEYVGLVQDFFLLPQVMGNLIWQIDCKPLRSLYFTGITLVRLLPHVYDYMRSPVPNPYFSEEYEFVNPTLDFYSKFGDIAIPTTAILLAAIVYIQQKWNYEKLSQTLVVGNCKLLPVGSRVYQRLPSQSSEAELVSSVNGNPSQRDKEHLHDDDDK